MFITTAMMSSGEPQGQSFKEFQDLPVIVREGLVYSQEKHGRVSKLYVTFYIQETYVEEDNVHPFEAFLSIAEDFLDPIETFKNRISMVRCYIDHDKDMMRAKLAWTEGY